MEITNDMVLEWFYSHDAEWQNDFMSDADASPSDETFYKYAIEHYSGAIAKYHNL